MTVERAVTAVIPTHDRPAMLSATLGAVLRQRDVDLEVVVVDDGSTRPVQRVVDAAGDERVRVVRHDRGRGVVAARNAGVAVASGAWVAFCDDDDLWAPDKLARQLAAAEQSGHRWVYTGSVDIDLAGRVIGGGPPVPPEEATAALHRFNAISGGGSSVVVAADLLADAGGFDSAFQGTHLEDWELWLRLASRALPDWVPAPLVGYRVHPANASLDVASLRAGLDRLQARHGIRPDRGAFERELGFSALRSGQRPAAMGAFARAAVRGSASGLLRDLAGHARHRLAARATRTMPATPVEQAWRSQAQRWLDGLTGQQSD